MPKHRHSLCVCLVKLLLGASRGRPETNTLQEGCCFWNPKQLTNSLVFRLGQVGKGKAGVSAGLSLVSLVTEPGGPRCLAFWITSFPRLREGYNPFSFGKLHPTPPRSCLAEREPFCLQPRKKSTERTSLGTNKGTSLGFYPKKLKKKRLTRRNKMRTLSSLAVYRLCSISSPRLWKQCQRQETNFITKSTTYE